MTAHEALALARELAKLSRWREAELVFRVSLDRQDTPEARLGLARALLAQGHFTEAWPLYEARIGQKGYPTDPGPIPKWRGEDLTGRRLVVWMEQGLGDQIQFARFLPSMRTRGAHLTVACDPLLAPLFAPLADDLISKQDRFRLGGFDVWAFSMSLPGPLGIARDNIPPPPYLSVPEAYRAKWRGRIPQRVGVVWRANPKAFNGPFRSLPSPDMLEPLRRCADIVDLQEPRGDFADLGAILQGLDLLITVDTGPAHLAGALGVPCWVMLPHPGFDWRWHDGASTPWYPSMRLFRQPSQGDWAGVVAEVAEALRRDQPAIATP